METIKEAFVTVLGEDFVRTMERRLLIIGGCVLLLILLLILYFILRGVTLSKVGKALRGLADTPDSRHARIFLIRMKKLNGLERGFAGRASRYGSITKNDCREIFNMTVYHSALLSETEKEEIRKALLGIGCTGLLTL